MKQNKVKVSAYSSLSKAILEVRKREVVYIESESSFYLIPGINRSLEPKFIAMIPTAM